MKTDPVTECDLWLLPLSGDRTPKPYLPTKQNEVSGRFSLDGRWLAYTSDESGSSEIYVQSFTLIGESKATPPTVILNWTAELKR